jgi:hypothetical protein
LRHLDLQVVGVHEVLTRHTEPARRDLLDRRALRVAVAERHVAVGVFATFAGVRAGTEPVHRDREVLVRFLADRAVAHRAGREALDDLGNRLHLVDRDRLALADLQFEQAAQRREALRLVVDELRVLLEDVVATGARRVLQLEHGVGVEEVVLPFAPPLVLTTDRQLTVRELLRPIRVRDRVPGRDLRRDHVDVDALDA